MFHKKFLFWQTINYPLLNFSQTPNFALPQSESLQTTISKFDANGRKFSKQVENTVGRGEIACYEQFLLFSQCFQKICNADTKKLGLVWERAKFVTYANKVKLC